MHLQIDARKPAQRVQSCDRVRFGTDGPAIVGWACIMYTLISNVWVPKAMAGNSARHAPIHIVSLVFTLPIFVSVALGSPILNCSASLTGKSQLGCVSK